MEASSARERGRRLDAQLIDEVAPVILVGAQRLDLTPGAIERQHELRTRALPERVCIDRPFELTDELHMASELELRIDAVLDRGDAQLLETGGLGAGKVVVRELCERGTAPESQRGVEGRDRPRHSAPLRLGARGEQPVLETRRVVLLRPNEEHIPGGAGDEQAVGSLVGLDEQAQPIDELLQRGPRRHGRVVTPEDVDEPVGRNHRVGVDQQRCQQRPQLRAPERHRLPVDDRTQWAERKELDPGRRPLHGTRLSHRSTAGNIRPCMRRSRRGVGIHRLVPAFGASSLGYALRTVNQRIRGSFAARYGLFRLHARTHREDAATRPRGS